MIFDINMWVKATNVNSSRSDEISHYQLTPLPAPPSCKTPSKLSPSLQGGRGWSWLQSVVPGAPGRMGDTWKRFRSTIMSSVKPKVDILGPEIERVPKKLKINNPLPDLKNVKYKIDNEGLNIIHLPKDIKINKGVLKFENIKPKVDFKGIEIFHGSPNKVEDSVTTAIADNLQEEENEDQTDPTELSSDSYEDYFLPFTPNFSRAVSSSSTSLPPTPPTKSPSLPSSASQTGIFRYNNRSPHTISPMELLISPKSLSLSQGSLKPRLPTPPDSPEIILSYRKSPPIIPAKTPTPPPSKIIQVSPIPQQDIFAQTDCVSYHDFNDQTEFEEPKKNSGLKWWQWLLLILLLLLIFVGIGLAIGYAVGLFGKKVKCSDGYIKIDNVCHIQTTTAQPTTTEPCDGCNCPKDVLLDPDSTDNSFEVLSPRYPEKYRHNSDCVWNFLSTRGQLEITFTKFNLEWARNCREKDYVFLDQVKFSSITFFIFVGSSGSNLRENVAVWALFAQQLPGADEQV